MVLSLSLCPLGRKRIRDGTVSVGEGGGEGRDESKRGHGTRVGGGCFVHTTVHLVKREEDRGEGWGEMRRGGDECGDVSLGVSERVRVRVS